MAMDQNNLWTGFQMPRRLAADTETLTERYGRFSAQPFERGFGTTVGNSLRRALLSSIEGAAITFRQGLRVGRQAARHLKTCPKIILIHSHSVQCPKNASDRRWRLGNATAGQG